MKANIDESELRKFANEYVFWWGDGWHKVDIAALLNFILAKKTIDVEILARKKFGFVDEDFKAALHCAPPGLFMFQSDWEEVNLRFGIIPPLPFPKFDQEEEYRELEELRQRQ